MPSLPESLDSKAMLPRAINARMAYVPGTGFFADGQGRGQMRLSFCFPPADQIAEGVAILGRVIAEELDLVRTFGT